MRERINRNSTIVNSIIFMIFSLISFIYFTIGQIFIPSYFKWDSGTIRAAFTEKLDYSYRAAAHFYAFFGFHNDTPEIYFQLFSWGIYLISLYTIIRINRNKIIDFQQFFLIGLFTLIYGAYFDTLSKDLILVLFLDVSINIFLSTRNYYFIFLFLYLYSYYYRSYWEIIAIMFLVTLILNIKSFKIYWVPLLNILFLIYYNFALNKQVTSVRLGVNHGRVANSMIFNIIPNNSIFTDIINYLYVFVSMIIPIQGIGSFNECFYYVFIWFIFYLIYKMRKKLNIRILYLIYIFYAFQACFEPDFGSALRHMSALFLLVYLFLYDKNNDIPCVYRRRKI